jgi:hypothetical protein
MLTGMKRIYARPRLRTLLVLCAACWFALGQLDGVLKILQEGGVGAYGANAFGPLSPIGLQGKVRQLLEIWNNEATLAIVTFIVYTAVDVAFIVLYGWLLLRLAKQLLVTAPPEESSPEKSPSEIALARLSRRAPTLIWMAMAADAAEDVLRLVMVTATVTWWPIVYGAWLLTLAKWMLLAAVAAVLVHAWRRVGLTKGPGAITPAVWWAIKRLRIPIVLLGTWGLLILFDPTQQTADTFRRWLDDPKTGLSLALWTLIAVALLGLATWAAIRRAVLASAADALEPINTRAWVMTEAEAETQAEKAKKAKKRALLSWGAWLVVLAALVLGGHTLSSRNLWGFAGAIGVVVLIEIGVRLFERWTREDENARNQRAVRLNNAAKRQMILAEAPGVHEVPGVQKAPDVHKTPDDRAEAVRRVARVVSTWPLLALLIALASAWTAPAVLLLAVGRDEARATIAAVLTIVAVVAATLVARWVPALLRRWDRRPVGTREFEIPYAIAAVICVGACAAAISAPLDVPPLAGVVAMTAVAVTALLMLLLEGQRYGDGHPPTHGLRVVGFVRIPVTLLLLVALAVAAAFDDGSSHAVARNDRAAPQPGGLTLKVAFDEWATRNCATEGGTQRTVPLVLVASHGGGIRAAYWTTSVLTQLLASPSTSAGDTACPTATAYDRVFAMAGASGGSLGEASYAGHPGDTAAEGRPWFRQTWGATDLVSVPVSWGLLVDLPRSLIGFGGPDRARRFEESWERQDHTLKDDFFAGQQRRGPLLLLAGTQVESGCRVNVSAIRLTVVEPRSAPAACAALGAGSDRDQDDGPLLPSAGLTSDVLDHLCGEDNPPGHSLNRSTAALLSARFPYVSPSGQLPACEGDRSTVAVVDGGYAENTGAQAALNLWQRLEPLVAAHNAAGVGRRIVPVFVHIDNHYGEAERAGAVHRTPELMVPPHVYGSVDKLDNRGVEQAANAAFSVGLPGLPQVTCRFGAVTGRRYVRIAPTEHPGIQAPLAWTLSAMAMDDLDQQREHAFGDVALHDEIDRGGTRTAAHILAQFLHGDESSACGNPTAQPR